MVNARTYLNYALSELEAATANKGGHRVNAINYVRQAIDEVNLGIQYAGQLTPRHTSCAASKVLELRAIEPSVEAAAREQRRVAA